MENEETKQEIVPFVPAPENVEVDDSGYYIEKGLTPPKKRNPNGSIGDQERQQRAWDEYIKTWRSGKPNATAAGLAAGFLPSTAHNLNNFKWFKARKDKLRRSNMLSKAEANFSRMLNIKYAKMKLKEDGTEEEEIDIDKLKVVADLSKTVVTTLGKDEGWSTKTEIGGKMESEIKINSVSYADPVQIENKVIEDNQNLLEEKIIEIATDK